MPDLSNLQSYLDNVPLPVVRFALIAVVTIMLLKFRHRIVARVSGLLTSRLPLGDTMAVVELINALPSDLRIRLLSLTVSPEGEVSLSLTNDGEVIFGRPDDFQVKLVAVVNEIKRQGTNRYAVIDVSSGQPSVR